MYSEHQDADWRRAVAAVVTLAVHAAIGAGLIWGLAGDDRAPIQGGTTRIVEVDVHPPPPPQPPPPPTAPREPAKERADNAGPKRQPLPVEAPEAALPLAPAPAAPVAGQSNDPVAGAGAQGIGAGAGAGGGTGGGGDGIGSPARRTAGALRDSDYPRAAEAEGLAGTVAISFRVRIDGRVDRCTVVRSSGHALLDDLTCRLFTQRFRFRPATDAAGAAVESTLQTSFTWGTRRR